MRSLRDFSGPLAWSLSFGRLARVAPRSAARLVVCLGGAGGAAEDTEFGAMAVVELYGAVRFGQGFP